jgi:hypothetical protein
MNMLCRSPLALACVFLACLAARASTLDPIGVALLQTVTNNLNGTGIRVGQAEADDPNTPPGTNTWEVSPNAVGQPTNLFTWIKGTSPFLSVSTANLFTNSLGLESGHADAVAGNFYGVSGGVATNVMHVDNYEANTFLNYYINNNHSISDPVVNQSFIVGLSSQSTVDQIYDNYAARHNTLFVSGIGNSGSVYPPATCYNGIGVAAYGGSSSLGPTPDNGRCKPDITAPAGATSFSTPLVAGAVAVLLQAGMRGDGGNDIIAATNSCTVKALLLNGAVKPADWTNGAATPLDARYGAGVLNVFNAYEQLLKRKQTNLVLGSVATNAAHFPTGATNTIGALSGWSFTNLTSSSSLDAVAHYYFNVTNAPNQAAFTATATLVWNRQQSQSSINNLQLFLYNAGNSNLVAVCTSAVDNVQHLFVPVLPPGRYDLQVLKRGGAYVSAAETYALAYEFFSLPLSLAKSGTNLVLHWPLYPAGFVLESAADLNPPGWWNTNGPAPGVTNNQNWVVTVATNPGQFFRLRRP